MTTPIALLLIALLLVGIGLFVRAYVQGTRWGERLEARRSAGEKETENRSAPDSSDAP